MQDTDVAILTQRARRWSRSESRAGYTLEA
jgi:hypothetical protein